MNKKLLLLPLLFLVFIAAIPEAFRAWGSQEKQLILAGETDQPMRVLHITNYADSLLLRQPSLPVKPDSTDTVLQHFIQRLFRTVRDSASLGVGIAAPQVGLMRQIVYVQRFDKEGFPFEVFLNPKITSYGDTLQLGTEGCLSIPDRREDVFRPTCIDLEYDRPDGSHHKEHVSGFTAVIFQHEIDHLHGILYPDHLAQERSEDKHYVVPKKLKK